MQQHVYNICNILSVLRLKACKRTYKAINARRTENVRNTHTPLTEHRTEQLGKDEVEEKKKSSGRVPPSVSEHREVPSQKATLLRTQDSPQIP